LRNTPENRAAELGAKVHQTVADPGVYLMRDAAGKILYVGKAKNLKRRLASYFSKARTNDVKTRTLLRRVVDFDTIVTASEKEALLLESNLIKRHRPRYNVILKDDKRYPVLRFDLSHPYPNLTIVRKFGRDGAAYFGPFASAHAVRETLKFINKHFRLRKCKNREFSQRARPCLHHQMGACYGPCCLEVKREFYQEIVDEVVLFLKGRTPELIRKIRADMDRAVKRLAFEEAAMLRDRLQAMETTLQGQSAVSRDLRDRDVITLAGGNQQMMVNVLSIRGGYLQGSRNWEITETLAGISELLSGLIRQIYKPGAQCPQEILLPHLPADADILIEWFRSEHGKSVKILHPQRGEKKRLLDMGLQNAQKALQEQVADRNRRQELMVRVGRQLKMKTVPHRIECFDNSNLFGQSPVAGMVVFEDGRADRAAYRKFAIRHVGKPDDYASMEEILRRRFASHPEWPLPDILLLDGGKGQLNIALDVVRKLGLDGRFSIAAIAKKESQRGETQDKVYLPQRANPLAFLPNDDVLLYFQKIRDEAHRFAISFHRRKRHQKAVTSRLDRIPGIGPKRKQTLLRHFKGLKAIKAATDDEISVLPGMNRKLAQIIRDNLASDDD